MILIPEKRLVKGILVAMEAARMSPCRKRHGAALYRGKRLIKVGWNSFKTHPRNESIFKWHHAETAALVGVKNLWKLTMYVVRLKQDGTLGLSKPCKTCQKLPLRKVYYSDV